MGTTGKFGHKGPLGGGQSENSNGEEDSDASDDNDGETNTEDLADDLGHRKDVEASYVYLPGYTPTLEDFCLCNIYRD